MHCLRTALALLAVVLGQAAEAGSTSAASATRAYTVILTVDHPATIQEERLGLELVSVKDGLCPSDVQCVWSGHASVTLKVSVAGATPQTVLIGTRAPPAMKLPFDADVAEFHLSLVGFEPARTSSVQPALSEYKVTVRVSHR